jgi:AcrR family transcriptional regulator
MARTVNKEEYARKREEILDVAQRMVQTQGYEQMSIQDLLDELAISKGAFYHYFPTKAALLQGLVDRMCDGVVTLLTAVVEEAGLAALDKLNRFFAAVAQWKGRDVNLYLAVVRTWYLDDNAILRQKVRAAMIKRIAPLFAQIVRQGMSEGAMTPAFPALVGELLAVLIQDMNDAVAFHLLESGSQAAQMDDLLEVYAAYGDAMERILALPAGVLVIATPEDLKEWLAARDGPFYTSL